jgi:hypothetical protein
VQGLGVASMSALVALIVAVMTHTGVEAAEIALGARATPTLIAIAVVCIRSRK